MSKTDITTPWKVREERGEIDFYETHVSGLTYRERGSGPQGVRMAKREAAKRRRQDSKRMCRDFDRFDLPSDPYMVLSLRTTYKYNVG